MQLVITDVLFKGVASEKEISILYFFFFRNGQMKKINGFQMCQCGIYCKVMAFLRKGQLVLLLERLQFSCTSPGFFFVNGQTFTVNDYIT